MRNIRGEVVKGLRVAAALALVTGIGAGVASADDTGQANMLAGQQLARVTYGLTAAPEPIRIAPLVPKIRADEHDSDGTAPVASISELAERVRAAAAVAEPAGASEAAEPADAAEATEAAVTVEAVELAEAVDAADVVEAAATVEVQKTVAVAEPAEQVRPFAETESQVSFAAHDADLGYVEDVEPVRFAKADTVSIAAVEAETTEATIAEATVEADAAGADALEAKDAVIDEADAKPRKGFWSIFHRNRSDDTVDDETDAGDAEPMQIARPVAAPKTTPPTKSAPAPSPVTPATTTQVAALPAVHAGEAAPKPLPIAAVENRPVPQAIQVAAASPEVAAAERFAGTTSTYGVTQNPPSVLAQSGAHRGGNIIRVLTGKSVLIDLKNDAKRVSVANPEVAEVVIISPRQVMVNGLAEGETSIIIWDRRGNYTMYSLVSGETLNQQVMLEVTVAEVNRTAMERHGMDLRSFGGQFGVVSNYGKGASLGGQNPPSEGDPMFPFGLDGGISWAIVDTKNNIAAMFQQIQDENLGRVLAEPKLLTRSGKQANFLSGGEIPIVVTQNDDTTIEFKEFGTKIDFVPRVREDGQIDLQVASEVSEPDFASGVELFGFTVPAFVTRRVDTDVSLQHGQSLIIAGLVKEVKQELESKMPFVGDIPFLGYFFRSTEYQKEVLELIMVIRPKLVGTIEAGQRVALPTDRGPLTRNEVKTKANDEKVTRPRPW